MRVQDTDGDQPHLTHLSTGVDNNMAFLWGKDSQDSHGFSAWVATKMMHILILTK